MPSISFTTNIETSSGVIGNSVNILKNSSVSSVGERVYSFPEISSIYTFNVEDISKEFLVHVYKQTEAELSSKCHFYVSNFSYDSTVHAYEESRLLEYIINAFTSISGYVPKALGQDSDYYQYDIDSFCTVYVFDSLNYAKQSLNVINSDESISSVANVELIDDLPSDPNKSIQISDVITFTVGDFYPFRVYDVNPVSGSVLRNLDSSISFSIRDDVSGILLSQLNVYVNGEHIFTNGVNTAVSGTLIWSINTPPSDNISFNYNPSYLFQEGHFINVVVTGKDLATPLANSANYSWGFTTYNKSDLTGSITILPDTESPFVENLYPADLSSNIPVCGPLEFDILDAATGVNLDTLNVQLNGEYLVENGIIQNNSVTINTIDSGFHIEYLPSSGFDYNTLYTLIIDSYDNYSLNPNYYLSTSTFTTVDNSTINISNLFIETVEESVLISTNTKIEFDIKDSVYGIDIDNSHLYLNNVEVTFDYSVITDGYHVSYDDPSLLSTDLSLVFVGSNSRLYPCLVSREFSYSFSYGYEITHIPDKKYEYNSTVVPVVYSSNDGLNFSDKTEVLLYKIRGLSHKDLEATIVSSLDEKFLYATIQPVSPLYYYNKLINVRVEASDIEGNQMEPFEFSFRIERKPN